MSNNQIDRVYISIEIGAFCPHPKYVFSTTGKVFGSGKEFSSTILFVAGVAISNVIPFVIKFAASYSFIMLMVIAVILKSYY